MTRTGNKTPEPDDEGDAPAVDTSLPDGAEPEAIELPIEENDFNSQPG